MLRLDAAGAILRLGLLARLFCEKFIFLGVVTQSLHINQQNTRQGALAVHEFADVDGVVTVTGTDVLEAGSAAHKNGWTYKGFGKLNGTSTSNLLLDYKAENSEAYWEMMQYLFGGEYPLFSNIKMEMGNDGNNSTGAEACTKRYEDEEADASRSPGFVMAADAKKINPDVKVSILRWEYPNWVMA